MKTMKLVLTMLAISGITISCNSGSNTPSTDSASITLEDKPTVGVDSNIVKKDSTVLDSTIADSTQN